MKPSLVERIGEGLARATNRRKFLRNTVAGLFGIISAAMAELTFVPSAHAINYCANRSDSFSCSPPAGIFCNSINSSYCNGPNCAGGCTFNTTWYSTACWCTQESCNSQFCTYYECCDCSCPGGRVCGCHQEVTGPNIRQQR